MANPNPKNKFPKGNKLGRKPGQPNLMPDEALGTHCAAPRPFGGVKAGGVQTAAAELYRLYLPHWNRFRKPPPDRAAEKGSVAEHFPMQKFPATRRLRGGRAVASCRRRHRAMTAQQPIPLRADPAALRQAERRSLVRACAALVLGNKPGVHPEQIIKTWGDDAMAAAILKVAQSV